MSSQHRLRDTRQHPEDGRACSALATRVGGGTGGVPGGRSATQRCGEEAPRRYRCGHRPMVAQRPATARCRMPPCTITQPTGNAVAETESSALHREPRVRVRRRRRDPGSHDQTVAGGVHDRHPRHRAVRVGWVQGTDDPVAAGQGRDRRPLLCVFTIIFWPAVGDVDADRGRARRLARLGDQSDQGARPGAPGFVGGYRSAALGKCPVASLADVTDPAALLAEVEAAAPTAIVHLAAILERHRLDRRSGLDLGREHHRHRQPGRGRAPRRARCAAAVMLGEVYGDMGYAPADESRPLAPRSPYAASKARRPSWPPSRRHARTASTS